MAATWNQLATNGFPEFCQKVNLPKMTVGFKTETERERERESVCVWMWMCVRERERKRKMDRAFCA